MLLSEISDKGTKVCKTDADGDYVLKCEAGEYVYLHAGFLSNSSQVNFTHPNVAALAPRLMDFKHYYASGRKKWTQKAGVEFVFIVRKTDIEVLPECGYSYPKVKIAGMETTFSCSGGTDGKVWCDWLRKHISLPVNMPAKFLKHLAKIAVSPEQVQGEVVEIRRLSPDHVKRWKGKVAQSNACKFLKIGMTIHTEEGVTWGGGYTGPFVLSRMDRGVYLGTKAEANGQFRITTNSVDWFKTAEANGFNIDVPEAMNKTGPVLPSHEEIEDQFYQDHANDWIATTAWGSPHNGTVPEGMVGVIARLGGPRKKGEERMFLVPQAEYNERSEHGFIVDPARHGEWLDEEVAALCDGRPLHKLVNA